MTPSRPISGGRLDASFLTRAKSVPAINNASVLWVNPDWFQEPMRLDVCRKIFKLLRLHRQEEIRYGMEWHAVILFRPGFKIQVIARIAAPALASFDRA